MKNKNSISSNQQNKASAWEGTLQSNEAKESLKDSRNSAKHTMANLAIKTFAELLTDLKSNADDVDKISGGATTFEIPR